MKTLEGFGILVGVIIGAGIFGLPYSFSGAPLSWNIFLFLGVFCLSVLLHLLFAGIIYTTPGKHRFPGYVQIYLGPRAETIATIFAALSSYGAMLAYGILGATFLQNIFGIDFFIGGILFFILGGALFFLSIDEIGKINFYLTLPLVCFILLMAFKIFPDIHPENFLVDGHSWFLAYGILVFAFGGYSALPDLRDILGARNRSLPKKIILWSLVAAALVYLVFIFTVLGVSGSFVTPDAISGLPSALGKGILVIGSLIGIFTVFRAYIGFGADLKLTYKYDYEIREVSAWFLSFLPPIFLFILGFVDLVRVLSVVGSVGLGIFAVFILLMVWERKGDVSTFLGFRVRGWWLSIIGILVVLGALQDLFAGFIF
ncbi:hypothetical protein A3H65_02670 [Candidatus Giovannonibacteria bacterium RIFCSPLOWO2_02_FULL_45_14]|uniref:Amino acid permease n=3 Tax=Parcubacteria group TaxID=1794811 RepID=A0A0H4TF70_9BACT|nr:amino acid permease [uncultured Parcubacteria bacterium Rifle_16ft_4_minimus_37658]AKQ05685.1 amino acid permease [uncultured Parcubacteria bacterium Rifle_16ft_4_minimus_23641]OGF69922.1 MAG: hypothetical protein A3C75_01085 [Candidatus Giovannonibacteria bacterium RIFCSPHIGHO2_02_FULL_44_31]OGF76961.1 MAG: hypothetical protein A3E62_01325 [Candidatus Giovannonibacteria bacterium RIFCSPHIGHO2_12_FULL_44_29]OGF90462.1 MAG: hypothetical protein A3H65_02670 [Candidatus Giovannonibacteria bacte